MEDFAAMVILQNFHFKEANLASTTTWFQDEINYLPLTISSCYYYLCKYDAIPTAIISFVMYCFCLYKLPTELLLHDLL